MPQKPFREPLHTILGDLRLFLENTYFDQQESMFVPQASVFIYALINLVSILLVLQVAFEVDSIVTTFNLLNF